MPAAGALRSLIEHDLQSQLAFDKATVTSDDEAMCQKLRSLLGDSAGPPTRIAQFLGIDEQLGRRRAILARESKWRARAKAATARRPRLTRLKAGRPAGAAKIFIAGVLPAATYGAEVMGVSTSELKQLQRTALSSMQPSTRGRSKSAPFTAKGDPTWRPATAPVLRWAREVWSAALPATTAVPTLSLPEMREV